MTVENICIDHIVTLYRVARSDDERKRLPGQIDTMPAYVHQLEEVDIEGIEVTLHVLEMRNVLRTDRREDNFSVENTRMNTVPQKHS
jgi:aspartyl-tRNA(Asn)/glutamyl-tRNA(Gln) amidotransferase subunit C